MLKKTSSTQTNTHWQTEVVHPSDTLPAGFQAFPVPVTRASTILFPNLATLRAAHWDSDECWSYGLNATQISFTLAQRLAALEGGRHTLLLPSGLSAISLVYFGLLKSGDDVLVVDTAYGPNREHADWLAENFNITSRPYDPLIGKGIAELIRPNTRLIWMESPGSVTMEVQDIPAITQIARARGVITALDNTWSAGIAFRSFEHGCDITIQALTKYQSGGSDVLMGSVTTNDRNLYSQLKLARMRMGLGVSADDCSLILRSLPTLKIRYETHSRAGLQVAQWFKQRPEVAAVHHPALTDCPGHEFWARDFSDGGGLFSVIFDSAFSSAQIDAFIEGLRFFKLGYSWGGTHSLAVPYDVTAIRSCTQWKHQGQLVRFYIGLEDINDLMADLEQSMATHLGHSPVTAVTEAHFKSA